MKWIKVSERLPEKDKLFWALITGREEPIMVSYPQLGYIPDYCIILLQMLDEDMEKGEFEAQTMDLCEAIYLKKNNCDGYWIQERTNCRAHGHFTHWLPFDSMPLPEPPKDSE